MLAGLGLILILRCSAPDARDMQHCLGHHSVATPSPLLPPGKVFLEGCWKGSTALCACQEGCQRAADRASLLGRLQRSLGLRGRARLLASLLHKHVALEGQHGRRLFAPLLLLEAPLHHVSAQQRYPCQQPSAIRDEFDVWGPALCVKPALGGCSSHPFFAPDVPLCYVPAYLAGHMRKDRSWEPSSANEQLL